MKTKLVTTIQITDNDGPGDSPFVADGNFTKSFIEALTDGTGSGKAQVVFADDRTLGAAANEELDLAGGLTDQFGQTITFTKIKALYVSAAAANAEIISVGGAAANTFDGPFADSTDIIEIQPEGIFFAADVNTGWTVTAGTGDLLKVLAGASGGDYTIIIVGEGSVA